MTISYETIIEQMIKRLENARHNKHDQEMFIKHIYHVHGLCELLIETGDSPSPKVANITDEHLKKMLENQSDTVSSSQIGKNDSLLDF